MSGVAVTMVKLVFSFFVGILAIAAAGNFYELSICACKPQGAAS